MSSFECRFDQAAQERGAFWFARDLMILLGYDDWAAFTRIVVAGTPANFRSRIRIVDGHDVDDFEVTRSGCRSIAIRADRSIPAVAEAQDYFVAEVRYEFEDLIEYRS